jgi:hypothetical protein
MTETPRGSIIAGMLWMFFISVLLFWLPGIGGLIAGVVGGMKAGGVFAGMTAAVLPVVIVGCAMFVLATAMSGMPVIGALAGAGGFVLALTHVGPLLVGAIIGGLLA